MGTGCSDFLAADLESALDASEFSSTIRKSRRILPMRQPGLVRFFFLLLLSFVGAASKPAGNQATSPSAEVQGTEPVIHALCGKRVALLGESPVHGFGETLEFGLKSLKVIVRHEHSERRLFGIVQALRPLTHDTDLPHSDHPAQQDERTHQGEGVP